ncbi:hypothetical protein C8039_02095 [Halogeometricum sp. wsp3]|nr:hypothetical protein C8039_02095 [Halogeometricum sp. wsp3]
MKVNHRPDTFRRHLDCGTWAVVLDSVCRMFPTTSSRRSSATTSISSGRLSERAVLVHRGRYLRCPFDDRS